MTETAGMGRVGMKAARWLKDIRKISEATLAQMPVASGTDFFPEINGEAPSLRFEYSHGYKARSYPEKHFTASKGVKREFYNLAAVLKSKLKVVYVVEGELDALALVEAGIPRDQVLGCHGAKDRPTEGSVFEVPGYAYVIDALKAGLNQADKIVWCGDADVAGLLLRADMVQLFGPARFHTVEWPEGVKDANDMLRADGPQDLRELVEQGAVIWPVDGLYHISGLPEPAQLVLWEPGFPEWESRVRLAPRTLSVVTGHPGHGKSALFQQIWFNIVKTYRVPIAIASFETRPKPHLRRWLRTFYHGFLEKDQSDEERAAADRFIEQYYLWMHHPDARPTLEWVLNMAEVAVKRHGVRIIKIDPWNRLEAMRNPAEREDEYVARCLRALYQFATDFNCHVQILAHPSKMDGHRRGTAPMLEDIAGAKHWDNMVDQGFTVHRPKMFDGTQRVTTAQLFHRKARFEELGWVCKLGMDFDLKKGLYRSVDYDIT